MKLIKIANIKKILSFFWKQNGSPYYNAKGIAVGILSGCFPFFGFQTLIGLFLARILRGNLTLAAIGTWISNPFTYVPLYIFNYKVGTLFIKNSSTLNIESNSINNGLWHQGWIVTLRILFGSLCVGLILGISSGVIGYVMYKYFLRKDN